MSRREGLPLCCRCVHNYIPSPGDTGSTSLRTLRLHPTSRNPQRSLACLQIPVTHATVPRDTPTCRQHCPGSGNRFKVASAMWGCGCKGYVGHKGQRTGGDSLAAMWYGRDPHRISRKIPRPLRKVQKVIKSAGLCDPVMGEKGRQLGKVTFSRE